MAVKSAKAVVNGVTINLALNLTTGKWEATGTAPTKSSYNQSGHYYGVTLEVTDDAGNTTTMDVTDSTLGSALKLVVKETTAPAIIITSPTASAILTNNKPTIVFTVTDTDSGVNPSTIKLSIDDGTTITGDSITKTAITNGYQCSYTPDTALTDGSHTIKFNASDNDGNAAAAKSVTFKIDTVPPTLSITSPTDGLVTNKATVTVSGVTNDVTSSPVTVTVNGKTVTVGSDGKFSTTVSLTVGSNTITIIAKDSAGKTSTVARTVEYDPNPPKITAVTITPNPVNTGKTFTISVTIEDN